MLVLLIRSVVGGSVLASVVLMLTQIMFVGLIKCVVMGLVLIIVTSVLTSF
jgi:hypothetical protein